MRESFAYLARSSVRVTSVRRVRPASARAADAAATRLPNRPNTAEPLPESSGMRSAPPAQRADEATDFRMTPRHHRLQIVASARLRSSAPRCRQPGDLDRAIRRPRCVLTPNAGMASTTHDAGASSSGNSRSPRSRPSAGTAFEKYGTSAPISEPRSTASSRATSAPARARRAPAAPPPRRCCRRPALPASECASRHAPRRRAGCRRGRHAPPHPLRRAPHEVGSIARTRGVVAFDAERGPARR